MRLELNVTHRCNSRCLDCNRAIGLATFDDMELTVEHIKAASWQLRRQGIRLSRVAIAGGEPTVRRDLQTLINTAALYLRPRRGLVLNNGTNSVVREQIRLPRRWRWRITPLDDTSQFDSGKAHHTPFFVSPVDLGTEGRFRHCRVTKRCGKGLEARGFTMCGVAGTLGRLLGIDPYSDELPLGEVPAGICRHCPYGLTKSQQRQLIDPLPPGTISETYQAAFAKQNLHQIGG